MRVKAVVKREILDGEDKGYVDTLDRIRAELEHVKDNPLFGMVSNDTMLAVILEIIDKYREDGK